MRSSPGNESEIDSDSEAEPLLPGFTFNAGQLTQMQECLHEYMSARGKDRTKLTVRVSHDLRKEMEHVLGRKISDEQRHSLLEGVRTWFRQNGRARPGDKPIWATNWNARLVFMKTNRTKIVALSEAMVAGEVDVEDWVELWQEGMESRGRVGRNPKTKGKKGDEDDWFFNHYQHATTALIELLSDKEWATYVKTAEKWKQDGPPPDIQCQMADKFAAKKGYEFLHKMKRDYNCVGVLFLGWEAEDGKPVAAVLDFNRTMGRNSNFNEANPKKMKGLFTDFRDYVYTTFNPEEEETDGGDAGVTEMRKPGGKKDLIEMERNSYGEPFLLTALEGKGPGETRGSWYMRAIRSFFTYHYALSRGSRVLVGFPWSRFLQDKRDFISEKFMSEEIIEVLKEPSQMKVPDRIAVFDHLVGRQRKAQANPDKADMQTFEICAYVDHAGEIVARKPRKLQEDNEDDYEDFSAAFDAVNSEASSSEKLNRRNRKKREKTGFQQEEEQRQGVCTITIAIRLSISLSRTNSSSEIPGDLW
ncbi:hypothetical protein BKA70DRAFT_1119239 [Coprinopsis sp. MPI-PUGE-AT-0042]|nr:hypothetical protein BKA70DRAFT_1119239 [Coprinopsis sp. MPI-PUGE-AT-0042]